MSKTYIQPHPPYEEVRLADNEEWENQCARCGSSMSYEHCECEDGWCYDDDDDGFDDLSRHYRCGTCDGGGGWQFCLSSPEWCEANPLPGRENIKRGTPEWFVVKLYPEDSP